MTLNETKKDIIINNDGTKLNNMDTCTLRPYSEVIISDNETY